MHLKGYTTARRHGFLLQLSDEIDESLYILLVTQFHRLGPLVS
jgi:hypothetical protein